MFFENVLYFGVISKVFKVVFIVINLNKFYIFIINFLVKRLFVLIIYLKYIIVFIIIFICIL